MRGRVAVRVLALVALGIGLYLSIERERGGAVACPVAGHGCETVQHSAYSTLAGVPVSTLGVVGAALLLATAFLRSGAAPVATFGLALAGAVFSLYLTGLEAFSIHAYCVWCLSSATVWVVAAIVAALGLRAADG